MTKHYREESPELTAKAMAEYREIIARQEAVWQEEEVEEDVDVYVFCQD